MEGLKPLEHSSVDTDEFNYYRQEQMGKDLDRIKLDLYGEGHEKGIMTRLALLEKASEHVVASLDRLLKWTMATVGAVAFLILETAVKFFLKV